MPSDRGAANNPAYSVFGFHRDDLPSGRSAFLLRLLRRAGQATRRAAGEVFFQRQFSSGLELNDSAPTIFFKEKAAKEQLPGASAESESHKL